MSREKGKGTIAHMSGEEKSTRERCIRVAAIVMAIIAGIRNSCGPSDSKYATAMDRTDIRRDVQLNDHPQLVDRREKPLPFKSKSKIAHTYDTALRRAKWGDVFN